MLEGCWSPPKDTRKGRNGGRTGNAMIKGGRRKTAKNTERENGREREREWKRKRVGNESERGRKGDGMR